MEEIENDFGWVLEEEINHREYIEEKLLDLRNVLDMMYEGLSAEIDELVELIAQTNIPKYETIDEEEITTITVDMPGLEKSDIKINATEKSIEVRGEKGKRKYAIRIPLSCEIVPNTTKAKYNNGVLEIKAVKRRAPSRGFYVKVE